MKKIMNDDNKYDHIRQLIARWYDGSASPVVEAEIFSFFAKVNTAELPDDLRDEAAVFGAFGDLSGKCPDADLLAEIDAAVEAEKVTGRKKFKFVYWLSAIAVAASLSLLVFTGLRIDTGSLATRPSENKVADITVVDTIPVVETPEVGSDEPVTVVPKPAVAKVPASNHELIAAVDGYREIEDPAEVARILDAIQKRYDETIESSVRALSETHRSLDNADRLVSSTLENI